MENLLEYAFLQKEFTEIALEALALLIYGARNIQRIGEIGNTLRPNRNRIEKLHSFAAILGTRETNFTK